MKKIIRIMGIGYVGLQNAITISKAGFKVIGFDKNNHRVNELQQGIDKNQEAVDFANSNLVFTNNLTDLEEANYFLISVPTPINEHRIPNLFPLKNAAKMFADIIKKNDVVILESTVFPGATRELIISHFGRK
jgi:UDP-N-acetyl-D-galactosamine dehydrogenase